LWHGIEVRRFLYLSLRYRYDMRTEMYVETPANSQPDDFFPPVLVTIMGEWCEDVDLTDPESELEAEWELEPESDREPESELESGPAPEPPPRDDVHMRNAQGYASSVRYWPGIPTIPFPANDGWNRDMDDYSEALFQLTPTQ
jgi:hypothetical protein